MPYDPNFPEGLRIEPSTGDGVLQAPDSRLTEGWTFDASAQREAIRKYGIAGRVWESAYILQLYIDPPTGWEFDPPFLNAFVEQLTPSRYIVELGSGSGIIGHCISQVIDRTRDVVIVTDLPEVCPLLEENLGKRSSNLLIRPLSWGITDEALRIHSELLDESSRFLTHVVCSDLVYFPELLAPLLRTLIQLSSPPFVSPTSPSEQTVIISYKIRSFAKESLFWSAFGLWFSFQPVLFKNKLSPSWTRTGSSEEMPFIFVAHRRPDSFSWTVPPNDQDLLHGVGTRGTQIRKSDDTFETLLLMSMADFNDDGV